MISQNQSCFNKLSKVSCLQNISHKLQLFPNNESELSQTIDSIISWVQHRYSDKELSKVKDQYFHEYGFIHSDHPLYEQRMNYFHCYLIFYRQNKKSKRIVDEYLSSIQEELFGIGVLHNNLKKSYEHKETLVKKVKETKKIITLKDCFTSEIYHIENNIFLSKISSPYFLQCYCIGLTTNKIICPYYIIYLPEELNYLRKKYKVSPQKTNLAKLAKKHIFN